jgi:molybdate transport system regulatory protein
MEISSNLTLELADKPFLLEKRIELLFAIAKEGSISKAAKAVPMSYKSAWEAIDTMNNLSPIPIVQKETGGAGGGGTKLTICGEKLLKMYTLLKEHQKKFLETLRDMTDMDSGTLKTIGRLSMQISARNQVQGIIDHIGRGSVNVEVSLKLKSGNTLTSNITNNAIDSLNLKVGDEVSAIFKSSSVLVSTDTDLVISGRNQLKGSVTAINVGDINAELIIDIGDTDKIASVITAGSVKNLNIEVGTKVCAVIKASDVMIGK